MRVRAQVSLEAQDLAGGVCALVAQVSLEAQVLAGCVCALVAQVSLEAQDLAGGVCALVADVPLDTTTPGIVLSAHLSPCLRFSWAVVVVCGLTRVASNGCHVTNRLESPARV